MPSGYPGSTPPCSVWSCDNKARARGLCPKHYSKLLTYGHPLASGRPTAMERFWSSFAIAENGCWEWTGALDRMGYGWFTVGVRPNSRRWPAHRWSLTMLGGAPIPVHLTDVDHLCRNHRCVNPVHLEAVTHAENMRRSASATAARCKNGHEWNEENTYIRKDKGTRQCRACGRERRRSKASPVDGTVTP